MNLQKGQTINFPGEKLPMKVMAVSSRYAVCSRKLNRKEDDDLLAFEVERAAFMTKERAWEFLKGSPVYTIIDFKEGIRGTDNTLFGDYDYFSETDCERVIRDLESGEIEISRRNRTELINMEPA